MLYTENNSGVMCSSNLLLAKKLGQILNAVKIQILSKNTKSKKSFPFMEDLMQQEEFIKLNKYKMKNEKRNEHTRLKMKKRDKREKYKRSPHKKAYRNRKKHKYRDRYNKGASKNNPFEDRDSDSSSGTYRPSGTKTNYYRDSDRSSSSSHRNSDRTRYDHHDKETRRAHDSVSLEKHHDRISRPSKNDVFNRSRHDEGSRKYRRARVSVLPDKYEHRTRRTSSNESCNNPSRSNRNNYDNRPISRYRDDRVSPRHSPVKVHPETDYWETDRSSDTVEFKTNTKYEPSNVYLPPSYRDDFNRDSTQSIPGDTPNTNTFAEHMRSGRQFILNVLQNKTNEPFDTGLNENSFNEKNSQSNLIQDKALKINMRKPYYQTAKQEPAKDYNRRYEASTDETNLENIMETQHLSVIPQCNVPEIICSKDPRLQALRCRSQQESLQMQALSSTSPALPSFMHPSVRNNQITYPDQGLLATSMGFTTNPTQPHAYWGNILPQIPQQSHPMMVPPVTTYNNIHHLSVSSTYTSSTRQPYQEPMKIHNESHPFEYQNFEQSRITRRAPITYGEYKRSRARILSTSEKNDDTATTSSNISQSYINSNPIPTVVTNAMGLKNFKIPKVTANDTITKNVNGSVSQVNKIENNESCFQEASDDRDSQSSFKPPSQANDSADNQCTEENTNKFLKELLNPNNLRALVNLMGEVAEVNNLNDVKEILEKRAQGTKDSTEMDKSNAPITRKEDCKTEVEKLRDHSHIMFRRYSVLKTTGERTPSSSHKLAITKAVDDVVVEEQKSKISSLRVRTARSYSTIDEASDSTTDPDEPLAKRANKMKSQKKLKLPIKNNNPEWHSLNAEMNCSICAKPQGRSLISHYVNDHPNEEVHTSRIPPVVAKFIHDPKHTSKFKRVSLQATDRGDPKIKQFCYFCNVYKCCTKSLWISHMAVHTGYYQYQCVDCLRKFAVKNRAHVCKDKNNLEKIPQPQFQKGKLIAYVCDVCNYVRFNESEIKQHLHSEHEANIKKSFNEVVFLQFPKNKKKREENTEESDNISETDDSETDYDDVQRSSKKANVKASKETKPIRVRLSSTAETHKTLKTITNSEGPTNKEVIKKRSVDGTEDVQNPANIISKRESVIKNNNPDFHSLNTFIKCQICDVHDRKSLVNHYVNFHSNNEVLTSRLAPEVANSLRSLEQGTESKISKLQIQGNIKPGEKLKQFCYFCNDYKCYSKWFWIEHLVKHTGYYPYKCSDCGTKFVRNDTSHVCKNKNNIEMVPQECFQAENVMAYICDVCNYVRFHEFEIQQHLHSQHDGNLTNNFKKFIFLCLPTNKTKKGFEGNDTQESVNIVNTEASNETSAAVPTRENYYQDEESWESFSNSD